MKKIINLTLLVTVICGILFSCTVDIPAATTTEESNYSAGVGRSTVIADQGEQEVQYEVILPYFVGNLEDGKKYLVIDNVEQFNTYFHYGMYTGARRPLNPVDFINNVVIAVVEPAEYKITDYTIEELELSEATLEFKYNSVKRDTPNTKFRFCQILLVEKAAYNKVAFIENDQQKAVVPVL